jgi:hypothetical protein
MTEEALRHLVEKRYSSRFGALAHDFDTAEAGSNSVASRITRFLISLEDGLLCLDLCSGDCS